MRTFANVCRRGGGKSTLQNEILGDLNLEFTAAPEKGEELPLDELGQSLGPGYSGALGKHTSGRISRMVGGKMPGGFNNTALKGFLTKTWGLGPLRSDAVLLLALTMEPAKRLGSEPEAKAWLDGVALLRRTQPPLVSPFRRVLPLVAAVVEEAEVQSSTARIRFQAAQHEFAKQQVDPHMFYLDLDPRSGARAVDVEKGNVAKLQAKLDTVTREQGHVYTDGLQSAFEPLKARHYDSSWNSVRQDALLMWYGVLHGRIST